MDANSPSIDLADVFAKVPHVFMCAAFVFVPLALLFG